MLACKDGKELNVEVLSWNDLLFFVEKVNPSLALVLEKFMIDDSGFKFYKANYKFGDKIINEGKCYLPLVGGGGIAFNDSNLPSEVSKDLAYNIDTEDPLGIVISKTSEFYISAQDSTYPHSLITPGQMFGITRAVDTNNVFPPASALIWNLNAGAKSLFMLSKISDKESHDKLQQKYKIKTAVPSSTNEHLGLFVELSNKLKSNWESEIIYFPRDWINKLKTSQWAEISTTLIHNHRKSYNLWHNLMVIWNAAFSEIEQEKGLVNYPMYSLATAKQMFIIAGNSAIGFKPATTDDMGPIADLQQAYINVYGLKGTNNNAVIMEPAKFDINSKLPIYYSINKPTFIQNSLEASKKKSQILLLEEIRWLNEIYRKNILAKKEHVKFLYDVTVSTNFSYYHTNPQDYDNIKEASLLAVEDERFTKNLPGLFPTNSAFFKGCIKIS
jgi:hypothetical protein